MNQPWSIRQSLLAVGAALIIAVPVWAVWERTVQYQDILEAATAMRTIYESSVVFIQRKHAGSDVLSTLPPQFPPSTGWTPARRCWLETCSAVRWKVESRRQEGWLVDEAGNKVQKIRTWKVLGLRFRDPIHFQYRYTSRGIGPGASFTAEARGGAHSYHELRRSGTLMPSGQIKSSDLEIVK